MTYLYVDLAAPVAAQTLGALELLRRNDTFCLNTEESALSLRMRAELMRFLKSCYPDPAPWELTAGGTESAGDVLPAGQAVR